MKNNHRQCEELKARIDALRPFPPETLQSLREYYRVSLTYSSNALEGNSLTESETKIVIEDGLTVDGKPLRDVNEAIGHAEAYNYIYDMVMEKTLAMEDLLTLHRLFYKRIDESQAGTWRKVRVFISGSHYPLPAPTQISSLMEDFISWFNREEKALHPVEFAALTYLKFVFILPFIDGNGQVGRLLMNLALLRAGYNIAIIPPILRRDYITSLEQARINIKVFVDFITAQIVESQRELLRLLGDDAVAHKGDSVSQLLQLIAQHPGNRVPALTKALGKSKPTVERYLAALKAEKRIEFKGAPKNGGYFIRYK